MEGLVSVSLPLPMTVDRAKSIVNKYLHKNVRMLGQTLVGDPRSGGSFVILPDYTKSLDSLIPIWKKKWEGHNDIQVALGAADVMNMASGYVYMNGVTIQEGACIATAIKIEETNELERQSTSNTFDPL